MNLVRQKKKKPSDSHDGNKQFVRCIKNIARGTTDPEIDSVTWTKFGDNMAPLA